LHVQKLRINSALLVIVDYVFIDKIMEEPNNMSEETQNVLKNKIQKYSKFENGHQIWTGALSKGSARIHYQGKKYQAKRLVLQLENRDVPENTRVKNIDECQEPLCILAEHLTVVPNSTAQEEPSEANYLWAKELLMKHTEKKDDHILWTKKSDDKVYGKHKKFFGKTYLTHQVSWMVANRQLIPKGLIVRHKCLEKLCINPEHLELGTHYDNAQDRKRDGTHLEGENHPNTLIDKTKATLIKESKGNGTRKERAEELGVSTAVVSSIDSGNSWLSLEKDDKKRKVLEEKKEKRNHKKRKMNRKREPTEKEYSRKLKRLELNCDKVLNSDMNNEYCWIWRLYKNDDGYGRTSFLDKPVYTHVLAWEATNLQKKPKDQVIRHRCRYRACCNPSHLEVGTRSENAQDCVRDGTDQRGEKNSNSKLTDDKVREIKAFKGTHAECSRHFDVSYSCVMGIRNGDRWKHVV
jgi:hypothetical protein